MTIDTSAPLFAATAEHLIDTVAEAREAAAVALRKAAVASAEAEIQRRRADALEAELWKSSNAERIALGASAYWKARCEQAEAELHDRPTVELPRVQSAPEPVRRRSRRGRHQ